MPEKINILPPAALLKGPDILRDLEGAVAFVMTPYKNDEGENFFYRDNGLGHEQWIQDPKIVQAMFGPKLHQQAPRITALKKELEENPVPPYHWKHKEYEAEKDKTLHDELWKKSEIYEKIPGGHRPTGRHKEEYSWEAVRNNSRNTSLYGRYGQLYGHEVLMLWPPPKDWVSRVPELLKKLNASDDTIVTVGSDSQFPASEFKNSSKKKSITKQAQVDLNRNKEYLDALQKYHVATGLEKERLAKILWPSGKGMRYPDFSGLASTEREKATNSFPWKRSHWRMKGREEGIPDLFSYGESTFRTFLRRECLMSEVKEKLNVALWKAYRLNIGLTNEFNLKVDQGMYMPRDTFPGSPGSCHPLECLLLGEEQKEVDALLDVARFLEVPIEWVIGFVEGYSKIEPTSKDTAHEEGFKLGLHLNENYEQAKYFNPAKVYPLH